MGRYERKIWFERLCELRDDYQAMDHTPIMTIAEAMAWAEQLLVDGTGEDAATPGRGERPTSAD
jgi:hypothetical protein